MKLLNYRFSIFIVLVILMPGIHPVMAQGIDALNFINYTKQQGLSNNMITGLAQDSTGYLWISTASGLNRFNGSSFVQFHNSDDSLSLPQENLGGLVWLDRQRLAAYTSAGLHIINSRTGETRNLFIPYHRRQYQFKFNGIKSVSSNHAGDVFLLTNSGFYHYDKNYRLVFRFDYYPENEVDTSYFSFGRKLFWLNPQQLLIVSFAGIYCYAPGRKEFRKMEATDCPLFSEFLDYPKRDYQFFQPSPGSFLILNSFSDSSIYINVAKNIKTVTRLPFHRLFDEFDYRSTLVATNDTSLYITGKLSGFFSMHLSPVSGKLQFLPGKNFSSYYCRYLMKDRENNLWIATNKGLFRQDNSRSSIGQGSIPESLQELYPNIILDDICVTRDKVYAATRGNGGVLEFNKQGLQFIRRFNFEKIYRSPAGIYGLVALNDSILLVGTNGPVCRLNVRTGKITEMPLEQYDRATGWVADITSKRNGTIWMSAGKIYRYDEKKTQFSLVPSSGIPVDKIVWANSLHEDAESNIWMAGHGLLRYNTHTHQFDRLIDSLPFIKIPDKQINSFTTDQKNNLWFNSNNNGLFCYNIKKGSFLHFTRDDGLPDNNIAAMIVIGNKLWMGTFSGIACLDLYSHRISSFGKEDGFPDEPISTGAKFFFDSLANQLYIGFVSTIVQFDPGLIFQKRTPPRLFIESLVTGDQKKLLFPQKNIRTSWRNNEITVTIGSINFTTGNSQRFAYRLVKEDSTGWQQLGAQNTFNISNLSPGTHRIQVKLFSLNNRWPVQVKEIDITLWPPFWKEPWFLVLAFVLLMLSVYLLLHWRTNTIRKKERAKTHLQELKAEEYKNQFELEQISNYFSSALAGKRDVDEILWDVAKKLIGRMNYADCMIYLWNEDKTKMIQKASYGPKGDPKAITEKVFDVSPGQGVVGYVMQTKEPVLIPDTRLDSRYRIDDLMRLSEICVPMLHNNELIGIIDSEHPNENHFKERDIKILTTIATLVSNKIKQLESEQSLEVKQQEIAFINQQLAEAQLSALQTQMNPHFIFNSLNSIKRMILANEQQNASRYLSKFAQMIRITLSQSKEIFTTLYENVEHLETYLMMEKLRFDDSFNFRITVGKNIDREETLIPTLMIQPLAENAIWHGLMNKEGDKQLAIHFSQMDETIYCTIEDNGIGIRHAEELKRLNRSPHQSVGLSNIRNRIKILNEKYDTGCRLEIMDLHDMDKEKTGTCVILCFKLIKNKP